MKALAVLFCNLFFISIAYGQALTVIYDSGNTFPVSKYYKESEPASINSGREMDIQLPKKQGIKLFYPILSEKVSPGVIKNRSGNIPHLQTPIFIVGPDVQSRQWLSEHKEQLVSVGAVGLLTDIENEAVLQSMQAFVPNLELIPMVVDDFIEQLDIQHYPVLISKTAIEQ